MQRPAGKDVYALVFNQNLPNGNNIMRKQSLPVKSKYEPPPIPKRTTCLPERAKLRNTFAPMFNTDKPVKANPTIPVPHLPPKSTFNNMPLVN